ncbi:MAG TPA: PilX N-terminal domain-containing pilus assembly protein [Arenimonas sp.]|uniref:pilus assembly PilX family protein n=1 Tax=Arenimonas sp. TaxID=1872635 RepID=UPI002D80DD3D|nr:PilX N-terminal domain-containing pilus assembly protein [Arenimonas sp.]HEU0153017.1 PilX N-terminal domain-containing pilus assembly protein [Arenimonas sp.]
MNRTGFHSPTRQRGVTLVVVLMLLIIVTLLGLASMRGTVMQERMSGNAAARAIAFQAAEAVLREAESYAADPGRPDPPSTGCSGGLCATPPQNAAAPWETDTFWTSGTGFRSSNLEAAADRDVELLRYVIEDMGEAGTLTGDCSGDIDLSVSDCTSSAVGRYFRITVLSRMANGTEVMLQSTYQAPVGG